MSLAEPQLLQVPEREREPAKKKTSVLEYTRSELEKQLELLQIHLTQHTRFDFCIDCVRKHWAAIEGLSEEGIVFTKSPGEKKLYESMAQWASEWRNNLPRDESAFGLATKEARAFRKDVVLAPLLASIEPILLASGTKDYNLRTQSNPDMEKPINLFDTRKGQERNMALTAKDGATILAASLVSRLGEIGMKYVDVALGRDGLPIEQRVKTYACPIGGAAIDAASYFAMKRWPRAQLAAFVFGSNWISQVEETGETLIAASAAGLVTAAPPAPVQAAGYISAGLAPQLR